MKRKVLNCLDVEKIKKHIRDNGLTMKEFARRCKLSVSTLYKLLGKWTEGSVTSAYKLSKGMGVKFKEIFNNTPLEDLFVDN